MTDKAIQRHSGWVRHGSRMIPYGGGRLTVVEDTVTRPDGTPGLYPYASLQPTARVTALDADGRVALVEEWIYTHGRFGRQLPGGGIKPSDPNALAAARRELAEETGYSAGTWRPLTVIEGANSRTNHLIYLFLATDLTAGTPHPEPGERLTTSWVPLRDAVAQARSGAIREAGTVAALLLVAGISGETP